MNDVTDLHSIQTFRYVFSELHEFGKVSNQKLLINHGNKIK